LLILKANKLNGIKIFDKSLKNGVPVIFPTDTIYGIGAFINDLKANEQIYEIKGRQKDKPFPILISNISQIDGLIAQPIDNKIETIIKRFWPGKNTLIFKANKNIHELFVYNGTIAIRFIEKNWLSDVISYFNIPLSATSANLSGKEYINDISIIIKNFETKISLYLVKKINSDKSSSIIDVSESEIKILRK
jgi:L-threonylcarbamoyladenylate synthase